MLRLGIDIGSSYTKYCLMDDQIINLWSEKTPIRQREYFENKISEIKNTYGECNIISCGYGRNNIKSIKKVNELSALAKGVEYLRPGADLVLDIGGQDTKVIVQEKGLLKEFYLNDKCAAGSGLFLSGICNLLKKKFSDIKINNSFEPIIKLSSVCAVFAQSEIVELIANNVEEDEILEAVIYQVLNKAKPLLNKVKYGDIILSGGFSNISNIGSLASYALERNVHVGLYHHYFSSIGCCLMI